MAHPTARLIAIALLASTALVACKKNADTTDTAPASTSSTDTTLPAAAPAPVPGAPVTGTPPAANTVSDLQLGTSVGTDNRVASPMTTFGTKDTLYASVTTAPNATGTLGARWTYLGADGNAAPVQVETQTQDLAGNASATHEFHVSKPDGWPAGKYRVEITRDGNVVQTRDFDVR